MEQEHTEAKNDKDTDTLVKSTALNHPNLPKGVGATALFVAIARDEARKLPHPPFSDPYARLLAAPLYDAETDSYPVLNKLAEKFGRSPVGLVCSTAIRTMWYDHQLNIAIQQGNHAAFSLALAQVFYKGLNNL